MPKTKVKDYYRLIASIISPFEKEIAPFHKQADWKRFVYISSDHLVLPAVYCQIIRKGWSTYFPKDLLTYLEAITEENRRRNRDLLAQIKEIASILNKAGIEYTLLKGGAMLTGGYYEDIGERMIGDIDILTHDSDSIAAYECLKTFGYYELPWEGMAPTTIDQYLKLRHLLKRRHLQRLIHQNKTGAIEIHNQLISGSKAKELEPEPFLLRKKEIKQGLVIPAQSDLHLHTIYNWHINDYGGIQLAISFRSAYDSLLQLQKHPELRLLQEKNPVVKNFNTLLSPFFQTLPQQESYLQTFYLIKLNYPTLGKIWHFFVGTGKSIKSLSPRLKLFLNYSDYRLKVLNILLHGRKKNETNF
jgi:hypothetical protein